MRIMYPSKINKYYAIYYLRNRKTNNIKGCYFSDYSILPLDEKGFLRLPIDKELYHLVPYIPLKYEFKLREGYEYILENVQYFSILEYRIVDNYIYSNEFKHYMNMFYKRHKEFDGSKIKFKKDIKKHEYKSDDRTYNSIPTQDLLGFSVTSFDNKKGYIVKQTNRLFWVKFENEIEIVGYQFPDALIKGRIKVNIKVPKKHIEYKLEKEEEHKKEKIRIIQKGNYYYVYGKDCDILINFIIKTKTVKKLNKEPKTIEDNNKKAVLINKNDIDIIEELLKKINYPFEIEKDYSESTKRITNILRLDSRQNRQCRKCRKLLSGECYGARNPKVCTDYESNDFLPN